MHAVTSQGRPGVPAHNLFGDHGPRCVPCSGLGRVLRPGLNGTPTKSASQCSCRGTGIDQEFLWQSERQALHTRLDALEKRLDREARRRREIESRIRHGGKMSRQFWTEMIAWATADGTAVANTTTEAILFPNVTIPANYMQDGRNLKLEAWGRWSNVVTAVPTMTFALRWGGVAGTILAQSSAIVTPATATTNAIWRVELTIQTRTNGATGTLFALGAVSVFEDAAPTFGTVTNYGVVSPMGSAGVAAPAAVTVDLTADTALSLTLDWSAANASNTATGHNYDIISSN